MLSKSKRKRHSSRLLGQLPDILT